MFSRAADDTSPGPPGWQTALLPLAEGPCPSCTALLDQLDGAAGHISQHVNLAVAAKGRSSASFHGAIRTAHAVRAVNAVDTPPRRGATLLLGGERPDGPGWFYPPTVLTGVTPEMRMYHEEVFGPVAQVRTVPSLEEALREANGHPYGLGANLWSEDEAERESCDVS
jgi:acyl-CoA reductase-like NAD-dependent aldehyde dehydrogenase